MGEVRTAGEFSGEYGTSYNGGRVKAGKRTIGTEGKDEIEGEGWKAISPDK